MNKKPDIQLSPDAFSDFFTEYKSHFVRIAFSYVRDMDAAKDIVTDSFVYLWEHRDQLDWDANIKGYVYVRVKTQCISHLRKLRNQYRIRKNMSESAYRQLRSGLDSLRNNDLTNKVLQNEVMAIFRDELSKMPELTRRVFQASRRDELTYRQIAEKYHLSVRRVTSEIQRALQLLRVSLHDYLLPALFLFLFFE